MSAPSKPTITLQELSKSIIDSWINSPFNGKKGLPKREMYKDSNWLCYVLHHAVVEAACHGLEILAAPNKAVFIASVVDAAPKFKIDTAHRWNIFQVLDKENGKTEFYTVDLTVDQFAPEQLVIPGTSTADENTFSRKKQPGDDDEDEAAVAERKKKEAEADAKIAENFTQPANYVPVVGTTRVKKDYLFKTVAGSKDWVGAGIFVATEQASIKDLEARREQWPYYLQTFLAVATRAKKLPDIPKACELHPDTLVAKNDATELGQACAYLGDRQGADAAKPQLDSFKFMFQRIKTCRKACAAKVSPSAQGGKNENDE